MEKKIKVVNSTAEQTVWLVEYRTMCAGSFNMNSNIAYVSNTLEGAEKFIKENKDYGYILAPDHSWWAVFSTGIDNEIYAKDLYFYNTNGKKLKEQPIPVNNEVEIELTHDEQRKLAMLAHNSNMTLNEFINKIIWKKILNEKKLSTLRRCKTNSNSRKQRTGRASISSKKRK